MTTIHIIAQTGEKTKFQGIQDRYKTVITLGLENRAQQTTCSKDRVD
jgi:hypothetical protein